MKVDVNTTYSIDNYSFKNFIQLSVQEKELVLSWRNHKDIRKWMTNTENVSLENHLKFIDSLLQRDDLYYWLVYDEETPIGVVDLFSVNRNENSSETGYYLNPELINTGIGFEFFYYFKVFIHDHLEIEKTTGFMQINNINSYMLITYFGGKIAGTQYLKNKPYFLMETVKSDFDSIKDGSNDILKFAKHIRNNKTDLKKRFNEINTKIA